MTKIKQVRTICRSRHGGCAVIAHVKKRQSHKGGGRSGIADQPLQYVFERAGDYTVLCCYVFVPSVICKDRSWIHLGRSNKW